jgi:hypothetical protein
LCIVIMSVQFTCPLIPFSTSGQNMWRLIYTSFVTVSPLEKFVFYTCLLHLSTPTSSPRAFRLRSSSSLGTV